MASTGVAALALGGFPSGQREKRVPCSTDDHDCLKKKNQQNITDALTMVSLVNRKKKANMAFHDWGFPSGQ